MPSSSVTEVTFFAVVVIVVRPARAVLVINVAVVVAAEAFAAAASKTALGTSSILTAVELSKHMNMDGDPSPGKMYVPHAPSEEVRQHPVRVSMSEQSPLEKAE